VKVLRDQCTDLNGNAFRKEFNNLSKLKHPNIVRLVGFCDDEEQELIEHDGKKIMASKLHRALCFEYLHNGSLQNHLSGTPYDIALHQLGHLNLKNRFPRTYIP
jgi:coatomer subunit beta'